MHVVMRKPNPTTPQQSKLHPCLSDTVPELASSLQSVPPQMVSSTYFHLKGPSLRNDFLIDKSRTSQGPFPLTALAKGSFQG